LWDANGQAAGAPTPNPIASSVVLMKLQYGIVDAAKNFTWVNAVPPWSAAEVLAAPAATLQQIQAVRIGVVVRSEQHDNDAPAATYSLFCNPGPCVSGALPAKFRYRTYETAIPLRNPVWNL
jgi:type IV pilus assembly protein PilW